MKRILVVLLALTMVLSTILLAACGQGGNTDTDSQTSSGDIDTKESETDVQVELPKNLVLYVSRDGKEGAAGTESDPFPTIEAARDFIRTLDKSNHTSILVNIAAGEYPTSSLQFEAQDSGTPDCIITYKANGEVLLNGGLSVSASEFKDVTDDAVLARLSDDAKSQVKVLDLFAKGVSREQLERIYVQGLYTTVSAYNDGNTGGANTNIELFLNGERMNLARYPNEGWLKVGRVIREGETVSNNDGVFLDPNDPPVPPIMELDDETAARVANWKDLTSGVWMYGRWKADWAPSSVPVAAYDASNKQLTHKYASWYGIESNTTYYFFNVFEELDSTGEWYLDRENGLLYIYACEDFANAKVELLLGKGWLLRVADVSNVCFDGLTVLNTRVDAVRVMNGTNVVLQNLIIKQTGRAGILATDCTDCVIQNCELSHIGYTGINISGGNIEFLVPGNNKVYNNLIHDFAETDLGDGIHVDGCANIVAHNELYNTPGQAITFSGPNNIIEYNEMYKVAQLTFDGGAIYGGRNWYSYGTTIRYNYIHDIGSDLFHPIGIYIDDDMSGITVHGNLLIDIPWWDINIGGGRDLTITNNIMVYTPAYDAGKKWEALHYDQRALDGLYGLGDYAFFKATQHSAGEQMWNKMYKNDVWLAAFPQIGLIEDYTEVDGVIGNVDGNINFGGNPSYSVLKNNVLTGCGGSAIVEIFDAVYQYSEVDKFILENDNNKTFKNWQEGDWTMRKSWVREKGIEYIDFSMMGRE